jgi:hypothetical protein
MEGKTHSVVDEFFKYASEVNDVITLEDAFVKWAEDKNYSVEELQNIYNGIIEEVNLRFADIRRIDIKTHAKNIINSILKPVDDVFTAEEGLSANSADKITIDPQDLSTQISNGISIIITRAYRDDLKKETDILGGVIPPEKENEIKNKILENLKTEGSTLDELAKDLKETMNKKKDEYVSILNRNHYKSIAKPLWNKIANLIINSLQFITIVIGLFVMFLKYFSRGSLTVIR